MHAGKLTATAAAVQQGSMRHVCTGVWTVLCTVGRLQPKVHRRCKASAAAWCWWYSVKQQGAWCTQRSKRGLQQGKCAYRTVGWGVRDEFGCICHT